MAEKPKGCLFCEKAAQQEDEKNLILTRSDSCFVILNAYPYNNGHLMLAPFRHIGDWGELEPEEISDIGFLLKECLRALRTALKPDGFNVGLNLGEVAGAGITDHLHIHVVPRWKGDTNFMPVLSATKVIPQHLEESYKLLSQTIACQRGEK